MVPSGSLCRSQRACDCAQAWKLTQRLLVCCLQALDHAGADWEGTYIEPGMDMASLWGSNPPWVPWTGGPGVEGLKSKLPFGELPTLAVPGLPLICHEL